MRTALELFSGLFRAARRRLTTLSFEQATNEKDLPGKFTVASPDGGTVLHSKWTISK